MRTAKTKKIKQTIELGESIFEKIMLLLPKDTQKELLKKHIKQNLEE